MLLKKKKKDGMRDTGNGEGRVGFEIKADMKATLAGTLGKQFIRTLGSSFCMHWALSH